MDRLLYPGFPILLVDDEESFTRTTALALLSEGISNITMCNESRTVHSLVEKLLPGIILLDISMPNLSGIELLPVLRRDFPDVTIIMVSGTNDVKTAVEAIKNGAFDYIVKPARKDELISTIRKAIELNDIKSETAALKKTVLDNKLQYPEAFNCIVTRNGQLLNLFKYTEAIAPTTLPVLITGETGVGKELLARAVHTLSRRKGEFVCVNVAGLDDTMFSDTLFGHRKGAYSGADTERKGLIESATGGTLFLDEIGDLSFESQVKLLRLIQDGSFYPLGSDLPKHSTARIIGATNRNLYQMQQTGTFRKDLYYRLEAHILEIPPLRERLDDLPLLIEFFFEEASQELKREKPAYPRELLSHLRQYSFPGNIRELRGMIFNAISRHTNGIVSLTTFDEKCFPVQNLPVKHSETVTTDNEITFPSVLPTLSEIEQALIDESLKRASGNKTLAAHMIGLTRQTLNNWMKKNSSEQNTTEIPKAHVGHQESGLKTV